MSNCTWQCKVGMNFGTLNSFLCNDFLNKKFYFKKLKNGLILNIIGNDVHKFIVKTKKSFYRQNFFLFIFY